MTRTIYAPVFAPDPQHEADGKLVHLMIYDGKIKWPAPIPTQKDVLPITGYAPVSDKDSMPLARR